MQIENIKATLLIIVLMALVFGCRTTNVSKIVPDTDMKYFIQVKEGETAEIEWNFENAHRVKIEGFAGSFLPEGSIEVKPEVSTEYKLTAYRGFTDSLDWTVYVEVLADFDTAQKKHEIKPGEPILVEKFTQPSYVESEFVSGIITQDVSTGPNELRIVRKKYSPDTKKAEVYTLLMDNLGNFISGYAKKKDSVTWNATNTCGQVSANYSNLKFDELSRNKDGSNVDFAVIIDNSGFAQDVNIKEPLKNFIKGMNIEDKVLISVFNQNYLNIFKLMDPQAAVLGFDDMFEIGKPSGFSASNNAMIHAIQGLNLGKNRHRALVLITYTNDNASVKNKISDVIRTANLSNVEIFVIGIGDIIDAAPYRYLCSATGGKFYILLNDEIEKFKDVLAEILFAYRNCYKIEIPLQTFEHNCTVKNTKLSFSDNKINLSAMVYYPSNFKEPENNVIPIAGFDTLSAEIPGIYYENLSRIANYLKKHPGSKFSLIGYSFLEGNKESAEHFAQMRAQKVKDYLVAKGVNGDDLVLKTKTDNIPLFTFPYNKWLSRLNRRVELTKYIPVVEQNYELIAAFAPSEVESQKIIQKWEQRGYKAYYIRTLTDKGLAYKVVLWGFKSKSEAEITIKKAKSKYKEYLIIDK